MHAGEPLLDQVQAEVGVLHKQVADEISGLVNALHLNCSRLICLDSICLSIIISFLSTMACLINMAVFEQE